MNYEPMRVKDVIRDLNEQDQDGEVTVECEWTDDTDDGKMVFTHCILVNGFVVCSWDAVDE